MEFATAVDVAVAAWELACEFDIADDVTEPPAWTMQSLTCMLPQTFFHAALLSTIEMESFRQVNYEGSKTPNQSSFYCQEQHMLASTNGTSLTI